MKASLPFCTTFLFSLLILNSSYAQEINPLPTIAGAKSDINYLAGGYLDPVGIALGNGLNNSWYSSAAVHPLGGFHINIAPSLIIVPSDGLSFTIDNDRLTELELVNPNNNITPTAFGENEEGPLLRGTGVGGIQNFRMPAGVGFSYLPLANINLGVGVGFASEVHVRFFPKSEISGLDGAQIGLFGIGGVHEVSKWFVDEDEPPFSLAVQFGYSRLSFEQDLDDGNGSDAQKLLMTSSGITLRAILSKQFSFFTLYGGFGYNSGNTDIDVEGTYSYQSGIIGGPTTIKDPISLQAEAQSLIGNIGGRLKIAKAISIFADYTFAKYSSLTLGLGVDLDFE